MSRAQECDQRNATTIHTGSFGRNHPSEASLKAFLPFSVGSRNCPGQALAQSEMTIVLARLISEYEFTVEQQGKKEYMVSLRPIGAKLRVKALSAK
jgi:cytochrome P450